MYELSCDVAVIGGGPAGLAAAVSAKKHGAEQVLIIERDSSLGGILQQCIHPGFGLTYYNEELTGPEYAGRFIQQARELKVEALLNSMVLEVLPDGTVICTNKEYGITKISAKSVVLAMGCRERTRGNIQIPGTRPAGIYTAGAAQRLINRQNEMVGRQVVILGSGDIGMIMARRLTLEGAKVAAVVEIMDFLAGLTRNRVQCLDDFGIPLLLSHTVTRIVGNQRVEGVYVAQVDENRKPMLETEEFYPCDTLLLSVGLIPENELSRTAQVEISPVTGGPVINQWMQTSLPCLFACGNVVHVNDLVDNVSLESEIAGREAARYAMGTLPESSGTVTCQPGDNVRYICPHHINLMEEDSEVDLYFRVNHPEEKVVIRLLCNGKELKKKRAVKVNPGEMEHIRVSLSDLTAGKLEVHVAKGV
ncbi:MAG: NAD(P)/FAD-dependent oxidoreductase [Oscillospiraceae bacterium]|jgi:NADPH-dependent 2,4-dienoyl-CoA reductase/sulfur reductase-like enzyme